MAAILDGILVGLILDGLDHWPRSATRTEWFRITRELVSQIIADMDLDLDLDLDLATMVEVEEAFIGAGLL
mgnify:CR=1 FL=1